MAEQPKEVCDVEVVLRGEYTGRNEAALDRLRGVGCPLGDGSHSLVGKGVPCKVAMTGVSVT